MKIAERLLFVLACALLLSATIFGLLSVRDPGPSTDPVEIPPPRIQSADLIEVLTGEAPASGALNAMFAPAIDEPPTTEIPALVAEALGRFVVEASGGTDTMDVGAATEFLRGRIELIGNLDYRDAYAKGLLSTSLQVLSNDTVIATARRTSANALANQYFEAYDAQFRREVMAAAKRLDELHERQEQLHRQASRDLFSASVCFVCLFFVGSAWLLVRHRRRKPEHVAAAL